MTGGISWENTVLLYIYISENKIFYYFYNKETFYLGEFAKVTFFFLDLFYWFLNLYVYCWHYYRCPHFPPLCPPPPSPHPLPSAITTLLCVSVPVGYAYVFLLNPFTFFHPVLPPPSLVIAVSLFRVSMPLFLLCSWDSTYKLDHMVFVVLWLAYFT